MNDLTRAFLADTRSVERDQIERIFEERLTALSAGVVQAVAESLAGARRELTSKLNQSVRRLCASQTEEQWAKAIVDGAQDFSDRAAVFPVRDGWIHFAAGRNLPASDQLPSVALASAPAFASAVETKDAVVALRTKSEMSEAIAQWAGEDSSGKFYLFPITAEARVVALLYGDAKAQNIETNGLELLAAVAGAVIESRDFTSAARTVLVKIDAPAAKPEDQGQRLKAERLARTQVAEIRLYKSETVKNGRAERNLYTSLKAEIDLARETYQREFLSGSDGPADYLHRELVRTLANDDVELLGPDYPGPLV